MKEIVDLSGSEYGGRFVEDEDLGFSKQGLKDLHALLFADGKLFDPSVDVDREPVSFGDGSHSLASCRKVDQPPASRLHACDEVLQDGEPVDEHKVLVDHTDAKADGMGRACNVNRHPVEENFAAILGVEAEEDLDEGALAGAVLTEQTVDFTCCNGEVDTVIGGETAKTLGDPAHLHCVPGQLLPPRRM